VPFAIQIVPSALHELQGFKNFYQRQIVDAIEEQLKHEPTTTTRHRKVLNVTEAPFGFNPPLWELRIASFRVFYDVDESHKNVFIRAVREKPPHATNEEVL
jgi:mRNA-degrading endonuclease RelE of RelBE toxin-antitoxin system